MIIATGNSPSSGSTYLADLLDSLPHAVCGPELHLFTSRCHFDDFESVRRRGFRRSATASCYAAFSVHFDWNMLPYYGITTRDIRVFLAEETMFRTFCERFFRHYADFLGKSARLFFEKTSENIRNAEQFLRVFPESIFLHIIRDPLLVFRSQRKRGVPFSVAAAAWLMDAAPAYGLRDHPRFYTLHYEDLVRDPRKTISRFLDFVGESRSLEDLEQLYQDNEYRSKFERSRKWRQRGYGRKGNASEGPLGSEAESAAKYMAGLRISPRFARWFGLPEVAFEEIAEHFGYPLDVDAGQNGDRTGLMDVKSSLWLAKKWAGDFAVMAAGPGDLPVYLSPVARV